MRSLLRIVPVLAVALMISSATSFSNSGSMGQNGGLDVFNSGFVCFPFICN